MVIWKYTSFLAVTVLIFFTGFSGIIRHDVPETDYRKLANEAQFDCVGQVYRDTEATASCVLIGERFLLSAAHVFVESDVKPDTIRTKEFTSIVYRTSGHRPADPGRFTILIKGHRMAIRRITLHPYYLRPLTIGTCDLAVIELEEPISDVQFARVNTFHNELNNEVVGVGFGASGIASKPESVQALCMKIAGENTIDSIGGETYEGYATLMYGDFDHPERKDCNRMGNAKPRSLEYICSGGDSGGGLFRKEKGKWELIGICSGSGIEVNRLLKTGYYGQVMNWTRVSVFSEWLKKQME